MPGPRTSRALAERVEIDFHRRGNRFRRVTWLIGLAAAVACLGWIVWAASRDQQTIYAAGPVAKPHKFIEHDCQKCHTTWSLGQRLIAWDETIRSVENESCEACHKGPEHHANQKPPHKQLSCAKCHHEHEGSERKLADVLDRECLACHGHLRTSDDTVHFDPGVMGFRSHWHPEFAINQVIRVGPYSESLRFWLIRPELEAFHRDGESETRWQDRARIAFNHAKHLKVEKDSSGKIVSGLRGSDRQFVDLSLDNCSACHQLDAERRYMQPINYEKHCRDCHPLLFDNLRFPLERDPERNRVPHGHPELIRGFLMEKYTDFVLQVPRRAKPGERVSSPLNVDQAEQVRQLVVDAERMVLDHLQTISGQTTRGGCRYCHVVHDPVGNEPFQVEPPRIPNRWLPHSVFNHDSHRFLKCDDCHSGVEKSSSTGDVLIPSISVCLKCHSSDPTEREPTLRSAGARSNCVECHVYHHRP